MQNFTKFIALLAVAAVGSGLNQRDNYRSTGRGRAGSDRHREECRHRPDPNGQDERRRSLYRPLPSGW